MVDIGTTPIILLTLVALIGLMTLRVPVALSLLVAGTFGLLLLDGPRVAASSIASVPYDTVESATLIVIPMFIIMGMFAKNGGMAKRLFLLIRPIARRLPGGVGIATIATSAGFGAVSGSSVATVSAVGQLSMSEMLRTGYRPNFAAGTLAAAGMLGIIIPPSIALVIYGSITGESIGALLIAGIIPGVQSAIIMAIYVSYRAWRDKTKTVTGSAATINHSSSKTLAQGASESSSSVATLAPPEPARDEPDSEGRLWFVLVEILILFGIVIGGIYTGIATPSESAAFGAVAAFVLMCFDLRTGGWTSIRGALRSSIRDTVETSVMIFALFIGASVFSTFIVRSDLPRDILRVLTDANLPPLLVVIFLLLLLVPLGMVVDGTSMLLITMPIAYPIVSALGFDGIWFGILAVMLIELGLITPPVGLNVYVAAKSAPGLTPEGVFRGVVPYYGVQLFVIVLTFVFPAITLWLPSQMG